MKKIIAFLTAFVILGSYASNAAVKIEISPAEWKIVYREPTEEEKKNITGYIPSDDKMRFAELDKENVYSGEYSMKAFNTREKKQNFTYLEIKAKDTSMLTSGKKYQVEFYAKGDFETKGIEAGFGTNSHPKLGMMISLNNSRYVKSEADENGWVKYSAELTYEDGDALHFYIHYGCSSIYIDDVAVITDGENVLSDGGFEQINSKEVPIPKGDDYCVSDSFSPDYPRMVFTSVAKTKIGVSWQNASGSIAKVGIYKLSGGENILINDSFSNGSGAWCNYIIENVDSIDPGIYKIITTFADGRQTEYLISAASYSKAPTSWNVSGEPGAAGKFLAIPGMCLVDENVAHSGEASIRLSFSANLAANLYRRILQNVNFEIGHKYKISFWSRGENASGFSSKYGWAWFDNDTGFHSVNGTYGWRYNEFFYTYKEDLGNNELMLIIEYPAHALWIDDYEVYEIDEDGNKIGENLIANGGFEDNVTGAVPSSVKSIEGVGGDGRVTLSWNNKTDDVITNLYRYVDGKYVLIGQFNPTNQSDIVVSGLKNDVEHTFAVSNLASNYVESPLTVCKVKTVSPDYRIGKAKVDGETLKDGDNTVSVKIENNKLEEDLKAEVMAVVRKGKLITGITSQKISVPMGEAITPELHVNIPAANECSVTVYVWDDFKIMKKLADNMVFKTE